MDLNDTLSAVVAERNFYRRLLDLGAANDVEPLLDEALALIVAVTGAHRWSSGGVAHDQGPAGVAHADAEVPHRLSIHPIPSAAPTAPGSAPAITTNEPGSNDV